MVTPCFEVSIIQVREGSETWWQIGGTGSHGEADAILKAKYELFSRVVCTMAGLKLHARSWRLKMFSELLLAAMEVGITVMLKPIGDEVDEPKSPGSEARGMNNG